MLNQPLFRFIFLALLAQLLICGSVSWGQTLLSSDDDDDEAPTLAPTERKQAERPARSISSGRSLWPAEAPNSDTAISKPEKPSARPLVNTSLPAIELAEAPPTPASSGSPNVMPPSRPLPSLNLSSLANESDLGVSEVRSLRLILAEAEFSTKKTLAARADLVSLYEQEVGKTCMPNVTDDLSYSGSLGNKPCNELLDRIFTLDPENPLAICARDGIDKRSCRSAFAKMEFDVYSAELEANPTIADAKLRKELTRLRERNKQLIEQYDIAVSKLISAERNEKKPELKFQRRAALRTHMASYLTLVCTSPRLRLSEVTHQEDSDDEISARGKAFLEDEEDRAPLHPRSSSSFAPPKFMKHTRIIADRCSRLIESSLSMIAGFPPAICNKWGYYSPTCVDAKRADKKRIAREYAASGRPMPSPTSAEEFKTF